VVISILLALIALEGLHVYRAARDLQSGEASLKLAVTELGSNPHDWTPQRLDAAQADQGRAAAAIRQGREQLESDPGLRGLSVLPWTGDQVMAAYHLSDAGLGAAFAVGDGVKVGRAYLGLGTQEAPPGKRALQLMQAAASSLQDADSQLSPPLVSLRADRGRRLVGPLRRRLDAALALLEPRESQIAVGAAASRIAPEVLGATGPTHYLVLFANPSELRPAGGYVGAAGAVTMDSGAPTLMFKGTDQYDAAIVHQFAIPYPLDRYLIFKDNSLGIADAGWDPDFPTTAKLSEEMYTKATGEHLAGTVQVDPYAVSALLALTGPVEVPGFGRFDAATFYPRLNYIVNVSQVPGASGKGALAPITQAILKSLLAQPVDSYTRILAILGQQAQGRHLLFSMHDRTAADLAARAGDDGAILKAPGDYLMVADANVGATKGDYYVKRAIDVKAEISAGGAQRHRLTLTYEMPETTDATDAALNDLYDGGAYHDYLRAYLPENASVAGASFTLDGTPTADKLDLVGFAHGHEYVGAYARVPRGHTLRLAIDYTIPQADGRGYQLYIQKQAGVPPSPYNLDISYPGGRYTTAGSLDTDKRASVRW
jgi:hypothetical protein